MVHYIKIKRVKEIYSNLKIFSKAMEVAKLAYANKTKEYVKALKMYCFIKMVTA